MNQIARVVIAITVSFAFAGCQKLEGTGGVITSTVVETDTGRVVKETVYCYSGADEKIAFAIFTNINAEEAVSTVGGNWHGQIVTKGGEVNIVFEGARESIEIEGTRYDYSGGRVFLVSHPEGKIAVKQVNLPITDAERDEEINRLSEQQEVQDFLKK